MNTAVRSWFVILKPVFGKDLMFSVINETVKT